MVQEKSWQSLNGREKLLARQGTAFAKLKDGYDDFFGFEESEKKKTE